MLKPVNKEKKIQDLQKLPEKVRNRMGYAKKGKMAKAKKGKMMYANVGMAAKKVREKANDTKAIWVWKLNQLEVLVQLEHQAWVYKMNKWYQESL